MSGTPLLLLSALALLLLLGGLGLWAWRRRGAVRVRRAARTLRHPVVLAHGLLGFDAVDVRGTKHDYFRGVPAQLRGLGSDVYVVRLPPVGSVAARAEALAQAVRALDARKVNIIAHSMGGLDARYALAHLGLARRVASLTTVGTPHRGTPLADVGTRVGERLGLKRVADALGLTTDAFYDLTTHRLTEFNRAVPDVKGVRYASLVGALPFRPLALHPLLLPTWAYLASCAGANDGVVPAASQAWGEVLDTVEADHWAQIGWSPRFDVEALYLGLVQALRARGL